MPYSPAMIRTLLALHAHPDDESSKTAATVAWYADQGVRCVLVMATGGEEGDILNPAMDQPGILERLAELRSEELEEAARIIGYARVVKLGYRDSGMPRSPANARPDAFANVPLDQPLRQVVRIIREERPQVVLAYDEHRGYPHPDHLRVHRLGLAAFQAAADSECFPEEGEPWEVAKLYAPVFTRSRLEKLHAALLERGLQSPLAEWIARREEEPDPEITARIPIAGTLERAREALRAHRTQIDPDGQWFQIPAELIRRVHPYEDFALLATRVPVEPPEEDLFEGT